MRTSAAFRIRRLSMNGPSLTLLLAFGLGNLAMLGWLAAAAAPLLIHLWSRRKYREVPWAAVTFLLAAMRRTSRRIQLQQWLLLAVRTLIILLVVLALAEPYGVGTLAGGFGGGPAHKVLVIDGSYSMAYRASETTLFQSAKQLASQLVRESGAADTFTIILMGEPSTTILRREVLDHSAVIAEIKSLRQAHAGADLPGALTLVAESLDDRSEAGRRPERQEVYFFTDLQRKTWGAPNSRPADAEVSIEDRLVALAKKAALVAVDLASPSAQNMAVTQLSSIQTFVTTAGETAIEATLHQFGSDSKQNLSVELLIDDEPIAEQTINIASDNDAALRFTHRFRTAGDHTVAVRAVGDLLAIDNARWLVVPARDEVRVLCVAGKTGAAKYVAGALDPDPTDASPVRPTIVSEGDLAELDLATFDCVFLCNVGQFAAGEVDRLVRYASAGGGVVIFLGDRIQVGAYNEQASNLIPARIGELVSAQRFGVDPLEYHHPIIAPFRGREGAGLLTTPVTSYFRLIVLPNNSGAAIVAALPGADPWIITAPLGLGRTVLVATDGSLSSVDAETGEPWTAWPTWPSFLPIVREMLAYAVGGQQSVWEQRVGSALAQRDRRPLRVGQVVDITRPDGTTASTRVENGPDGGIWNYDATDLSGIYTVRSAREAEPQHFAINIDAAESDLSRVDPAELPAELLIRQTPRVGGDTAVDDLVLRSGWQQSFLMAAFGLLLFESLLAWRFGRGVL